MNLNSAIVLNYYYFFKIKVLAYFYFSKSITAEGKENAEWQDVATVHVR